MCQMAYLLWESTEMSPNHILVNVGWWAFSYAKACLFYFALSSFFTPSISLQMLTDLNTYLNKAIPDTRLTIKKYLDVKFEYLVSCSFCFNYSFRKNKRLKMHILWKIIPIFFMLWIYTQRILIKLLLFIFLCVYISNNSV